MCLPRERRERFSRFLFCVLMALSVPSVALDGPAPEQQKAVLALYGSRPDLPANILVDEIIRSTLERELGPRLDFYAEFLDTARWPEAESQAAARDFLRRRYAQKKLSAIIAVARPAINFMRLYGNELFPGVPIIVYGDSEALNGWDPSRPITGTLGKVDLSGTVELILRLQPRTQEILVISGASASDQWLQSMARRQLEALEKRVKFTYLTGIAVEGLARTVTRVPDGTAILFLSMLQDSTGNKLLSHEVLVRIAKEARVPIYSQSGINVGSGTVGGVVFNPESLGRETAQLTLRVLRGERLQDLPVQESKSTVPMVDWRQLRRWGLDEKRLPPGTVVRFREASVWDSYKWYIVGAVCLLWVQTSLIVGLLWQRAIRRKAEASRKESEDRLAGIVGTAMDAIIAIDEQHRIVLFNHAAEKMFGCRRQEVVGTSIERFIPERLRPEHAEHIQRFGQSGVAARLMSSRGVLWAMRTNGEEFPIEASISHPETDGKNVFTVIIRDIRERLQAETAMKESEERFRLVANTAPVMIWMSGTDKMCNYVNKPWLDFTGRTLEQELGNGWTDSVHSEDFAECMKTYTEAFDKREQFEMEYRLRRKDGEYRWISAIGVPRFNDDGTFAGNIGSCIDVTERKHAEEALSTIGRRLIEAHEEERTWIGRELHDDINQKLALLAIEMEQWSREGSRAEFTQHLGDAKKRILELSMDVQALSHRLHSSKLDYLGLAVAARSFCKEVSEKAKVNVQFSHTAVPSTMPKEVSLCLFRVLQEALQNAIKYSGVSHFHVNLRGTSNGVELKVSDDGKGFDEHEQFSRQGLGLISMRERLQMVQGVLEVKTQTGAGTTILAWVPTQTAELRAIAG